MDPSQLQLAAARLRLNSQGQYRAIATPLQAQPAASRPSADLTTHWGLARGVIAVTGEAIEGHAGVGVACTPSELTVSWQSAMFALPVGETNAATFADDFGALWGLLVAVERQGSALPPDVERVTSAIEGGWTEDELPALATGGSLRAVASVRGLHHSTVAGRIPHLTTVLGYDPLSGLGRTRLHVALMQRRLRNAQIR
jgi:hypothetical protein